MKERPTKITDQQEKEFYKRVAEEIIKNKWSTDDLGLVIEDVSEISENEIGYEIAKDLEKSWKKANYKIDTQFIEFLDDFGYDKADILRENVKAWVAAHNPQPKYSVGQKLLIETTLNYYKKKGLIVYVIGFSLEQACYLIHENMESSRGTVIAYEKVEANCLPM